MSLGKVAEAAGEAGKAAGQMVAIKSPKLVQFIHDNPLLAAIVFAICAVVVIFVLYKIYKKIFKDD